jgi:hypothetical protein
MMPVFLQAYLTLYFHAITNPISDLQDRDGAKLVLEKVKNALPRLKKIWADGGYAGKLVDWVLDTCQWVLEVVKRNDDVQEGLKFCHIVGL